MNAADDDLLNNFGYFERLSEVRRLVVVDMRFNLGPGGFRKFVKMHAALYRQDYKRAAYEMRHSLWYRQVKSRAERLSNAMEYNVLPI